MVIDIIIVYHFVDPGLRVKTFFEKGRVAENGAVDFEIGDSDTSAHLYWRLKKIPCRACQLFYCALGEKKKKIGFKSSLDLHFHPASLHY